MSDFSGLRLALTALEAHKRGLEVAAQNVANANTEGYSRQRVDLVAIGAPAVPALFSKFEGDGGGVKVDDVTRFRDAFMEIRAAFEHGVDGEPRCRRVDDDRASSSCSTSRPRPGSAQQLSDLLVELRRRREPSRRRGGAYTAARARRHGCGDLQLHERRSSRRCAATRSPSSARPSPTSTRRRRRSRSSTRRSRPTRSRASRSTT